MKKHYPLSILFLLFAFIANAQTNPIITNWLQNTTTYATYYDPDAVVQPTTTTMTSLSGCQEVQYDDDYVYITTTGLPFYTTGIFTGDGNSTLADNQDAMYKFPLNPTENTGTKTTTSVGNNGLFIDGVSLFDWQDTVEYYASGENGICGGPSGTDCPRGYTSTWNRDAVPAETLGFDCGKGHPAGTNYHHHQNPSPFKYDGTTSTTYSSICDVYDSEGLYVINTSEHSPLIGFAYDGFPIYGAYAYKNADGTGDITRMKSSYSVDASATTRTNGPDIDEVIGTQTFFNGYFREDYSYTDNSALGDDYLDEYNGRFCVTPEYPDGIYCYFATVNEDNSSAFPYMIGPSFYGTVAASLYGTSSTVVSGTTVYDSSSTASLSTNDFDVENDGIYVYPNPAQDYVIVQVDFTTSNLTVQLIDGLGRILQTSAISKGSTLARLETDTLYNGLYLVKVSSGSSSKTIKLLISK
jgi:hypothetical protein